MLAATITFTILAVSAISSRDGNVSNSRFKRVFFPVGLAGLDFECNLSDFGKAGFYNNAQAVPEINKGTEEGIIDTPKYTVWELRITGNGTPR